MRPIDRHGSAGNLRSIPGAKPETSISRSATRGFGTNIVPPSTWSASHQQP